VKKADPLVRKPKPRLRRGKFWRMLFALVLYLILLPFAIAQIINDWVYRRRRR
jgi:hypothetical protein